MSTDLAHLIEAQLNLQTERMKDGNPQELVGDEWAMFMTWNAHALAGEIHEAFDEIGWKPWATSRHNNQAAFLAEMVDAFHFFMNLLIAGLPQCSPQEIAEMFCERYYEKNAINAKRQEEGYDGVSSKCPQCHRELTETDPHQHWRSIEGDLYCTKHCAAQKLGRERVML